MKYVFGLYSQLSSGTSDEVFESVLNSQIKPFLTFLYNNPKFKSLFRLSIAELEWLETNHPEINMLISDLSRKGQLEFLSSSYYDSVINFVPTHERSSHIEKTTVFLRKLFSKKPRGLWVNYQVFNTSLVQILEMSSLDYIVISAYNQSINSVLYNKPFVMNQMGKDTVVFPTDDRLSKIISENYKNDNSISKLEDEIRKGIKISSNVINTYMVNADSMMFYNGTENFYQFIFTLLGEDSVLPSEYLEEHPVSKKYYLPSGIYGRDFNLQKKYSINQHIFDDEILSKFYFNNYFLRNLIKNTKKNTDERKNLDDLLMQASNSYFYFPGFIDSSSVFRNCSKTVCSIEKNLVDNGDYSVLDADINGDMTPEVLVPGKNYLVCINTRGAYLSKFNVFNVLYDYLYRCENGMFFDLLKSSKSSKSVNSINKKFEITAFDKRRNDFIASTNIEIDKCPLSFIKRFKFRQNSISLEIEIENLSDKYIGNISYENYMNISFEKDPETVIDSDEIQSFCLDDFTNEISFSFVLSDASSVSSKSVNKNFINLTDSGRNMYQYTQLKIHKMFSVNPFETFHYSITLKIDKIKGDKYDIKQ